MYVFLEIIQFYVFYRRGHQVSKSVADNVKAEASVGLESFFAFNRKGGISDELGLEGRCALAAKISHFFFYHCCKTERNIRKKRFILAYGWFQRVRD